MLSRCERTRSKNEFLGETEPKPLVKATYNHAVKKVCLLLVAIGLFFSATSLSAQESRGVPPRTFQLFVSHTARLVHFRSTKVGSQSIVRILRENIPLDLDKSLTPCDATASYDDYFKFAFVRNPWDRLVSCYFHWIIRAKAPRSFGPCKGKNFDYFIKWVAQQDLTAADVHIRLQTEQIPKDGVDFIGRFERFEEDLTLVLNRIGLEGVRIPHKNATKHAHYSKYYTEETREIVARLYKEDIEAFGYEFEVR